MTTHLQHIEECRLVMIQTRLLAENAAADYRHAIQHYVNQQRAGGMSLRACARELGLSDTSLRDLMRPAGVSRSRAR